MEGLEYYQDNSKPIIDIDLAREIVQYIRNQRHDFMNDFQVIWGYLQLDRPEDAKNYIARNMKNQEVYSKILNLDNAVLSIILYDQIKKAEKHGISVDFCTELDCIRDDIFISLGHEKLDIMNRLFNMIVDTVSGSGFEKIMYTNIYKQYGKLYIQYSINYCENSETAGKNRLMNLYSLKNGIIESSPEIGTYIENIDNKVTAKVWFNYEDTM